VMNQLLLMVLHLLRQCSGKLVKVEISCIAYLG